MWRRISRRKLPQERSAFTVGLVIAGVVCFLIRRISHRFVPELGEASRLKPEFDKRNVKVIGLSVDPADSHTRWAEDIRETQGSALNFPVFADPNHEVGEL